MEKHIISQGKKLAYSTYGKGSPVMLVHGFGEDDKVWKIQVDALKKEYQLIIPQLPGTGGSAMTEELSMDSMATSLKNILDAEGIKNATIIGHSMGGYITLAFAEKFSESLNGFGLFHSSSFADSEEKIATRKKGIALIKEKGGHAFLKTATPNLFSDKTKDERPELVAEQLEQAGSISDLSLVSYYEAMISRPDRTEVLRKTKIPVLFTMGKYDKAIPISDSLQQCHLPEKSYIHILDQSGHMGMIEEPEKSNSILKNFLSAV